MFSHCGWGSNQVTSTHILSKPREFCLLGKIQPNVANCGIFDLPYHPLINTNEPMSDMMKVSIQQLSTRARPCIVKCVNSSNIQHCGEAWQKHGPWYILNVDTITH